MRRDEKVAQVRKWMHEAPEAPALIAAAMRRNGVASISELAEKHPKQFNSLHAALATMEEELPEPRTLPWER